MDDSLKIISWNCAGAFRRKFVALAEFDADLWVIQECENPVRQGPGDPDARAFREFVGENYVWLGDNANRGLAVFAPKGLALKKLRWWDRGLSMFLPVRVDDRFNLINVWTKEAPRREHRYIGQLAHYLGHHGRKIATGDHVVCGDFNSHVQWDHLFKTTNHSTVVAHLARLGLDSVYHHDHGLAQGQEPDPTFYLYRDVTKPYHLDYAFASRRFLGREKSHIGDPKKWLSHSDHMPLVFEIRDD